MLLKLFCALTLLLKVSLAQEIRPVFAVFHALESLNGQPYWTPRAKISVDSLTQGSASLQENTLTTEEEDKLERLGAVDGRYLVKVVDTSTGHWVQAYTPAVRDPLNKSLRVSLDASGFLEGVSLIEDEQRVLLDVMASAPVPDTQTYVQRLDQERREKEKNQGQDNRGFLAKYWMYIVPVVVFLLISGAANPDGAR